MTRRVSHVQEHDHEGVAYSLGRQHFLSQEIGLPQTGRVGSDELIPCWAGALRAWLQAVLPEDIADGALADRANSEFAELAYNSRIAPGVFFGEFDDQS